MMVSLRTEEMSPELAQQYLAKSIGNRRINSDAVLALALDMERGKWDDGASEIVFDENGALVDGHHRLHAVVVAGVSVMMGIKRGVNASARNVIDTGRARTIKDLLGMYRPDVTNAVKRKSALHVCIQLLMNEGKIPLIRTLSAYESWLKPFSDGIDFVVESGMGVGKGQQDRFLVSPVTGAFAFAFKLHPEKVAAFYHRVATGERLESDSAEFSLRNFILMGALRGNGGGYARIYAARKVLTAIHHGIKGKPLVKLQDGQVGRDFFLTAYDTKAIARMTEPWAKEDEAATAEPS